MCTRVYPETRSHENMAAAIGSQGAHGAGAASHVRAQTRQTRRCCWEITGASIHTGPVSAGPPVGEKQRGGGVPGITLTKSHFQRCESQEIVFDTSFCALTQQKKRQPPHPHTPPDRVDARSTSPAHPPQLSPPTDGEQSCGGRTCAATCTGRNQLLPLTDHQPDVGSEGCFSRFPAEESDRCVCVRVSRSTSPGKVVSCSSAA